MAGPEQFIEALRHAARFRPPPSLADPIAATLARIRSNPGCMQARLLARVLGAFVSRPGDFRLAEIFAFDAEMLDLVMSLLSAAPIRPPGGPAWLAASDEADAAVAAAGALAPAP